MSIDSKAAREHLRAADPKLAAWMALVGDLDLPAPKRFSLIDALARSILHQQLHGKAAATIVARVETALGSKTMTAARLAAIAEADLRACGVSGAKCRALKDLAHKARLLPSLQTLQQMSNDDAIETITTVRGIGPWTVQMMLMFRLARPDILPLTDFGIRAGAQHVLGTPAMPDARALAEHGERWAPYRTLASLYLWRIVDLARSDVAT